MKTEIRISLTIDDVAYSGKTEVICTPTGLNDETACVAATGTATLLLIEMIQKLKEKGAFQPPSLTSSPRS